MLGVVACVLAVVCKRMQQLPTMLGPAVHRRKDTTHKTLQTMCNARAWPHQYWKSCANGSNVVALRFGDHGTKEVGSCWLIQTLRNKVCKRTQHVTSNNLASVARSLTLHKRRYTIYHDLFLVVCGVYNFVGIRIARAPTRIGQWSVQESVSTKEAETHGRNYKLLGSGNN